jgi:polar amino acid transport system substrate-binding protein
MMTRRHLTLAGFGLLTLLASVSCVPSAPLPDLGGREVTVAVINDYPPFNFIDPATGAGAGWDYDVVGELGRRLNFQPVFVTVPRTEILSSVEAGTYDMAANGITNTYLRAERMAFSRQYMIVRQRLVVRAGESRFATLLAAKEYPALKVGALTDSTNYDAAAGYFGATQVESYTDFEHLVAALLSGEVDAAIMDDVAYDAQQSLHPGQLDTLRGVLYGDLLAFPFPLSSDLVGPIDLALNAMDKDGTLHAFNEKWVSTPE